VEQTLVSTVSTVDTPILTSATPPPQCKRLSRGMAILRHGPWVSAHARAERLVSGAIVSLGRLEMHPLAVVHRAPSGVQPALRILVTFLHHLLIDTTKTNKYKMKTYPALESFNVPDARVDNSGYMGAFRLPVRGVRKKKIQPAGKNFPDPPYGQPECPHVT